MMYSSGDDDFVRFEELMQKMLPEGGSPYPAGS